jgi:hypothetical protein
MSVIIHHSVDPTHLKYCTECISNEVLRLEEIKKIKMRELEDLKYIGSKYQACIEDPNAFCAYTVFKLPEKLVTDVDLNELKSKLIHLESKHTKLKDLLNQLHNVEIKTKAVNMNVDIIRSDLMYQIYTLIDHTEEIKSKMNWLKYDNAFLSNINIWNDLFTIYIESEYGIINKFQMSITMEPDYLNAAFGECVLALYCLSYKTKLKYYTPMPFGMQSYFVDATKKRYLLYIGEDRNWKATLNEGIKAMLVCMKEIEMRLKLTFRGSIDLKKDLIGGCSYFYPANHKDLNNQKVWNNAFRYILSNLKMCLVKISASTI